MVLAFLTAIFVFTRYFTLSPDLTNVTTVEMDDVFSPLDILL